MYYTQSLYLSRLTSALVTLLRHTMNFTLARPSTALAVTQQVAMP